MPVPTSNIEDVFHRINKFTTLKFCCDKSKTVHNFNYVRDYILDKMREEDPVFNYLSKGCSLTGSYADNLKVLKPNEFDLLILIKFKYPPEVVKDENRPGNVKINMNNSLEKYQKHTNTDFVYRALKKMCDSEGFLLHRKFQAWFQGMMHKIGLQGLTLKDENGRRYSIRYCTSGPAHTCRVKADPVNFCIDLVPAVLLDVTSWCAPTRCPRKARNYNWHAIPKPIYTACGEVDNTSVSWQGSYADMERVIIDKCNNLKNSLRMLKKLRDRQNFGTFKSYFIKTIYLRECSRQKKEFWDQSIVTIVFYMLEKWCDYLESATLPFYWDGECNLLGNKSYCTMAYQFKNVLQKLRECHKSNPEGILEFFLTDDEISQLSSREKKTEPAPAFNQTDNVKTSKNSLLSTIIAAFRKLFT